MQRASYTREYATVKSYLERIGAPFFEDGKAIGSTPVANITHLVKNYLKSDDSNAFYLKEEYRNPLTLSVKGRAVASMVLKDVRSGTILSSSGEKKRWIEPTSGNTGKGLAEIAKLLDFEFTAVFSRLDVSEDIKAELAKFGAKIVTIGAEYSLADLEALAKRHKKSIVYYWTTPRKISPESLALFKGVAGSNAILKEIEPRYLVDHIIGPAAEALRAPLIARVRRGEFEELKKTISSYIPELNAPNTIVAFLCPLGNTSMAINTLLSQLGFDNVCNVKGGVDSLRGANDPGSSEYCPLPGAAISSSSIDFVKKLVKDNPDEYFTFMQYENEENVKAHVLTTGPELASQVPGLTAVICTFGTGGTATGLAEYFKDRNVSVYAAFPEQPVEGIRTLRGAEGLAFYKPEKYAGVLKVGNSKAYELLKFFVQKGVMIGPSTAIALQAAIDLPLNNMTCAVIAADSIGNYRSEYGSLLNF